MKLNLHFDFVDFLYGLMCSVYSMAVLENKALTIDIISGATGEICPEMENAILPRILEDAMAWSRRFPPALAGSKQFLVLRI